METFEKLTELLYGKVFKDEMLGANNPHIAGFQTVKRDGGGTYGAYIGFFRA